MTNDRFELSRRKVLAGLGGVGLASTGAGLGTTAYFSDEEQFTDSQLVAGELDMLVDWEEHYADWSADEEAAVSDVVMPAAGGTLSPDDYPDDYMGLPDPRNAMIAVPRTDVMALMDATAVEAFPDEDDDGKQDLIKTRDQLSDGVKTKEQIESEFRAQFANVPDELDSDLRTESSRGDPLVYLRDVKPGDFGEVTFSLHLFNNPGYIWLDAEILENADNGMTEPEEKDDDESGPNDDGHNPGELLDAVHALVWHDDGDNVLEPTEIVHAPHDVDSTRPSRSTATTASSPAEPSARSSKARPMAASRSTPTRDPRSATATRTRRPGTSASRGGCRSTTPTRSRRTPSASIWAFTLSSVVTTTAPDCRPSEIVPADLTGSLLFAQSPSKRRVNVLDRCFRLDQGAAKPQFRRISRRLKQCVSPSIRPIDSLDKPGRVDPPHGNRQPPAKQVVRVSDRWLSSRRVGPHAAGPMGVIEHAKRTVVQQVVGRHRVRACTRVQAQTRERCSPFDVRRCRRTAGVCHGRFEPRDHSHREAASQSMTDRRLTRRKVLGGLGTAGVATAAIAQFGSAGTTYTNATVLTDADDTPVLTIEWREQYNGHVVDRAAVDSETPEGELPAFVTSNVLPGDSGGVLLHLTVPPSDGEPETCLSFEMHTVDVSERGETEPERKADASTSLDEAIDATVWYDTGPFRSNVLYSCNGRRDPGETELATGSLATVSDTLSGSSSPVEVSCLTPSESLCLGFDWRLDREVSNAVQSDQVTVAFDVVIESSGGRDS